MFRRAPKSKIKKVLHERFFSERSIKGYRNEKQSAIPMAAGCILSSIYFAEQSIKNKNSYNIPIMNPDVPAFFVANFIFSTYLRMINNKIRSGVINWDGAMDYSNNIETSFTLLYSFYKIEYSIKESFCESTALKYKKETYRDEPGRAESMLLKDIHMIPKNTSDFQYENCAQDRRFDDQLIDVLSFSKSYTPAFIDSMMEVSRLVGWDPQTLLIARIR